MKPLLRQVPLLALLMASFTGQPTDVWAQKRTQAPVVLPDAPKPGEQTGTTEEKKDTRRPRTVKDYYLEEQASKYEALAAQKRDEAIDKLQQILASGNITGDQKAEMLLRLAELYYDKSKYLTMKEMSAYDALYAKWFDDPRPEAERGPEPKPDTTESKKYVTLAVDLYREILRDYPKYQRTDEVLFYLAFNLMDLGEDRESLEKYQTLVKGYPNSAFVPDAFLAIGEYFFERNQAFKALTNYKKAASYPDTRVYAFATYKLGWAYYNVGEYQEAIAAMKEVVAKSEATEAGGMNLKEDALKDLVLFFAEAQDIEAAYSYFTRFADSKYYRASLKQLAAMYTEQSKFEEAIDTYRKLIAEDPNARDTPSVQGKIIQAYFRQGKKRETLDQIEVLVQTYGPASAWARANGSDADALKEANDLIQGQLIAVAVDYHKEARKTKSRKTYEAAYDSYKRYLELFPTAEDAYDVRFAFAEIKYDLRLYEEAAEEYARVVAMDPKGKNLEVAASSWIVSIDNVLKKPEHKAALPENKKDPTPLNPWEQQKVEASIKFAELLPQHEDTPSILYSAGRIYYDHNEYQKAGPVFLQVIERYPTHRTAEISANLILDGYNQLEDWENLNKMARLFYDNPNIATGTFKQELKDLYEKATFKIVQASEVTAAQKVKAADGTQGPLQKEDARRVSGEYVKFYEEFPDSSVADVALNNAAVYAFQGGEVQRSIDLRKTLLSKFPESKLRQKNLEALGRNYETVADYDTAATYFEQLVASDKDQSYPGTADALYNAALYRESLGEWQKAIDHYREYNRRYPDREDSQQVLLEIARILETHQKLQEATDLYKKLIADKETKLTADQLFEVRAKLGRGLRKMSQESAALKLYEESVALYDKEKAAGTTMQVASYYVAEMRFYLVQPLARKFYDVKLELPEKTLLERLNQKAQLLSQTQDAYSAVISLGEGEWGMAALHEIGMMYKHFAEAMLQSPIPPYLKGSQIAIYEAGLQDRAYPLFDKAAEAMEQCLAKAYELGIYNTYTASAAKLLAELRPKEYPPLAERLGTAEHLSEALYRSDFITR